jgi:mannose-6-phosphate isomerase-like protein (cupin superfamily)
MQGAFVRIYGPSESPWRCGHWNGSPLEIGVSRGVLKRVPPTETYHNHDFHEYYVVLHGRAMLRVEGRDVPMEAGTVLMVQPGERHRVTWVDPDKGARWVAIKERSAPDGKVVVPEPQSGDVTPDG